uniref:Uncharacterized protein n=1 Tax=Steinernema glaseri TaxID=37863 RepID=A0A1I7YUM5_9BILA
MLVLAAVFVSVMLCSTQSAPAKVKISADAEEVIRIAIDEWSHGNHPFLSDRLRDFIREKCPRFFPMFSHDTLQIRILQERFPPALLDLIASYQVQQVVAMTGEYSESAKNMDKRAFAAYYNMLEALEKKYSKTDNECPMLSETLT